MSVEKQQLIKRNLPRHQRPSIQRICNTCQWKCQSLMPILAFSLLAFLKRPILMLPHANFQLIVQTWPTVSHYKQTRLCSCLLQSDLAFFEVHIRLNRTLQSRLLLCQDRSYLLCLITSHPVKKECLLDAGRIFPLWFILSLKQCFQGRVCFYLQDTCLKPTFPYGHHRGL